MFEFWGERQRPCKKDWIPCRVRVSKKDAINAVLKMLREEIQEDENNLRMLKSQLALAKRGILTPPYI